MQKFQNSLNITETKKIALSGTTLPELAEYLKKIPGGEKQPPYRAKQIFSWIKRGARSFDDMTNLPEEFKKTMKEHAVIRGSRIYKKQCGFDGTIKLVMQLSGGETSPIGSGGSTGGVLIETVLLPSFSEKYYTACLSTQAGCPMGCVFCKTGSMGFIRNLETSEIAEPYLFLNDELNMNNRISNVVVMGMGEPLLNLPALRKALEILCDPSGFGLSKRKITVSTAGICEGIIDMAENGPETALAVSIASACEDLRCRLMPGASKYSLSRLKEALVFYQKKQSRRITIETVLLGGINTGTSDAQALIDFTRNIDVAINLIPWNPVNELYFEGKKLRKSGQKEIENFTSVLENGGLTVTRRYRRGSSIAGACGQLGITAKDTLL